MSHVLHLLLLKSSNEIHQKTAEAISTFGLQFSLEPFHDSSDISSELKKNHWDAVIVDGTNGKFNVDAVFEHIRKIKDVPVIGIVNEENELKRIQSVKKGIHDLVFVNKMEQLPVSLLRILNLEKKLRTHELVESELQQKVNFLTDLFNAVQEGLCVIDTKFTILQSNSWFKKTFGKKGNPNGRKCYEIFVNRDNPCPKCNLIEDLEQHGVVKETLSIVDDNNSVRWLEINSYPLKNSAQQIIGVIKSIKDITSQKIAEHELVKLNEELDQRVKQRTAQLEAANRELEAFSYSVSHDLRAPLVRIDGFSQLLLDCHADDLNDEARHYIKRIRSSVLLMSQLIDDLLDLSRVTRTQMDIREVDLSKIAKQIIHNLQEAEPTRKVDVFIQPDLKVRGDAHLLTRVLDNLLNNAWKFTSKKSDARIEFGMAKQQSVPVFFVKDNGAGFNQKYVNQLFTPFRRLHSNKEFPGSGIGLATVQRIIHRHGGKIWAEGKIDRGAVFYFTLGADAK